MNLVIANPSIGKVFRENGGSNVDNRQADVVGIGVEKAKLSAAIQRGAERLERSHREPVIADRHRHSADG
jgi:hypothetical protein